MAGYVGFNFNYHIVSDTFNKVWGSWKIFGMPKDDDVKFLRIKWCPIIWKLNERSFGQHKKGQV